MRNGTCKYCGGDVSMAGDDMCEPCYGKIQDLLIQDGMTPTKFVQALKKMTPKDQFGEMSNAIQV